MNTRKGRRKDEVVVPVESQINLATFCVNYTRVGGKPFKGVESILEAQIWLRTCGKIFNGLKIEDEQRRFLASWQLQERAWSWWETIIRNEPEEDISWSRFKEVFEERYIHEAGRSFVYKEFLNLKQENMTVEEYLRKFDELSIFGSNLISTPWKKNEKFVA